MSEKLLDYREALERLGGDEEFLKELLTELIIQVDSNMDVLLDAIDNKDYSSLKSLSHSLKGASANLNVTRMAMHFYELERLGSEQKTTGAKDCVKLVIQDRNALKEFLESGFSLD